MSSNQNPGFAEIVKAKAVSRNNEISTYHANRHSFPVQEDLRLTEKTASIANIFFHEKILPDHQAGKSRVLKIEHKERQFHILLANLHCASATRPLRVSLNNNTYTDGLRLTTFFIFLVNWLKVNGYLIMLKGTNFDHIGGKRWTRIIPTMQLKRELLSGLIVQNDPDAIPETDLVILRNKVKKPTRYDDTRFTKSLKKQLRIINRCNSQHSVTVRIGRRIQFVNTSLHAVFNRTFKENGRLYTGKLGYQNLYREDRSNILIDGHKTVELDFSALHPRLLYSLKGIDYDRDPYNAVTADARLRGPLKILLLAIFNSADQHQAVCAGNFAFSKENKLYSAVKKSGCTVKQLVKMFKTAHEPIADYFFTGQGVRLMNIDSQIALGVLSHFAEREEACLCVHDSFIVEESLEYELMEVMQSNYGKITEKYSPDRRRYYCKIDKK